MNREILQLAASRHPHEIQYPFNKIWRECGIDVVCTLAEHMSGATIYVPALRTIFSGCLEEEARREYDGSNLFELAKKYGFTERHLRRLII